jgi:hypothetical protein
MEYTVTYCFVDVRLFDFSKERPKLTRKLDVFYTGVATKKVQRNSLQIFWLRTELVSKYGDLRVTITRKEF